MLLIDRKMPKSCIDCVCNDDNYRCNMTGDELDYDVAWTGRMPNCPLKEEERKTGKWIVTSEFEDCRYVKCNQCKVTQVFYYNKPLTNFCPNCGADMRGEKDGE